MTINERFKTIINILFGGNKRAFALHVGVSPTVVENVVGTRQGKPSFDFLQKVCANANISTEWLLMGKGEMLMDMFEIRTTPMVMHSDPEQYIKEGKVEIKDEDDSVADNNSEPHGILLRLLKEKDSEIGNLREDIGKLKERNAQLERENMDLRTISNRNIAPQDVEQVFVEPETVQKV